MKPRKYQSEAIELLKKSIGRGNKKVMLALPTGSGKEQPYSEPVLTPAGWVDMGTLVVGDFVIGSNGHGTKITAIHEQGDKDVYTVNFTDGTSVRCGEAHLWETHKNANSYD